MVRYRENCFSFLGTSENERENTEMANRWELIMWLWMALVRVEVTTEGTIVVYDCESLQMTLHAIDLTMPKACSVTTSHYDSPKRLHVEILKAVQHRSTQTYVCQAYLTLEVSRCGFDSLHYGTQTAVFR